MCQDWGKKDRENEVEFFCFLSDLGYVLNWKAHLRRIGRDTSHASWEQYVKGMGRREPRRPGMPGCNEPSSPVVGSKEDDPKAKVTQVAYDVWLEFDRENTVRAIDSTVYKPSNHTPAHQGTMHWHFKALEMLEDHSPSVHNVRHDLEAFFWLLIWIVLRHTRIAHWRAHTFHNSVFGGDTDWTGAAHKLYFINHRVEWQVEGAEPLNTLVCSLKRSVAYQNPMIGGQNPVPLTYAKILDLLSETLAAPGWPQDDCAVPLAPPSRMTRSASQCSSRSSSLEGEEQPQVPVDETDPLTLPRHMREGFYRRRES